MKLNCITEVAIAVRDLEAAIRHLDEVFEVQHGRRLQLPAHARSTG